MWRYLDQEYSGEEHQGVRDAVPEDEEVGGGIEGVERGRGETQDREVGAEQPVGRAEEPGE